MESPHAGFTTNKHTLLFNLFFLILFILVPLVYSDDLNSTIKDTTLNISSEANDISKNVTYNSTHNNSNDATSTNKTATELQCTIPAVQVPGSKIFYVTVLGQRYTVAYHVNSIALPPNRSTCCPSDFLPILKGWKIAENNHNSHLVAKMFSFGADALVFSDGSAYLTIESGKPNRKDSWNVISEKALKWDKNGKVTVDYGKRSNTKWGWPYYWCFRVLLTQPASAKDTDLVVANVNRTIAPYVTIGKNDYATLDSIDSTILWGTKGVPVRQMGAYVLPLNWTFVAERVVQSTHLGSFGSGCLIGDTGRAFYNTDKSPCGNLTLYSHILPNGTTIVWPNAWAGSLRIPIMRPTTPTKLNTQDMRVLLLSPKTTTSDNILEYAKAILEDRNLKYDNIGVITNNGQFIGDLPLYTVSQQGYIPHYHTIVLTSGSLSYKRSDGEWESGLPNQQWTRLRHYCSQFNVRLVSVYTYPGFRYGVTTPKLRPSLEKTYLWYRNESSWLLEKNSVWHYPVTLNASIPDVEPCFFFTAGNSHPTSKDKIGGVQLRRKEREHGAELHMFFSSSLDVSHGRAVGKKVIEWAMQDVEIIRSKGISIGAIVGIIIGGLVVCAVIGLVIFSLCRRTLKEGDREVDDLAQWDYAQAGS